MASFKSFAFIIGIPSSENPIAPAAANPSISLNSSPLSPLVTVATEYTLIPVSLPLSRTYFRVSTLSTTGFVLPMQTTDVNPPALAASAPV